MRLVRIPEPFDHPDFLFEPKIDGFAHACQHGVSYGWQANLAKVVHRSAKVDLISLTCTSQAHCASNQAS